MNEQFWIELILWALAVGAGLIAFISRIIYQNFMKRVDILSERQTRFEEKVEARLRTLGHEDRETNSNLIGLQSMLINAIQEFHKHKEK